MQTTLLFVGDEHGLRSPKARARKDMRLSTASPNPSFGHSIKLRRVALEITQFDLAKRVGMHQVTLSRIETGVIPLTEKMKKRIEKVLDKLEAS